jgi:hypothetical protein
MLQITNDEGSPNDRMTNGIAERPPALYFVLCHSALIYHSSFVFRRVYANAKGKEQFHVYAASSFFSRVPEHFLEGSVAGEDAAQAVLA